MSRTLRTALSRRAVLRGLGTAVALPLLDAMGVPLLRAAGAEDAAPGTHPQRLAWMYFPNGAHMQDWTPKAEGAEYVLPASLTSLEPHKKDLLVLSGLAQDQARAHGDGPGDHARSVAVFLTCAHPVKTKGANIRVGVSADQVAAQKIGAATRFASVELGIEGGRQSGNCDSGYSCAYSSNMSWRTPTTPVAKEINPRLVFERLFNDGKPGESKEARAKRLRRRKSVLDFVGRDARALKKKIGVADRAKLEEYLSGLRDIERRIERSEDERKAGKDPAADFDVPAGVPGDRREHMRLMMDLLVLAFQTDTTRVATFMLANGGSNASFPWIGVRGAHHGLTHHGGNKQKIEDVKRINHFHVSQYAYLLAKMKGVKEGEGTLLDNSMIVLGSGIGDGNRHNHDNLPVLLAGGGGGTLKTGRHVRYPRWTPLGNLYVSMLERAGAKVTAIGDSKGKLAGLG